MAVLLAEQLVARLGVEPKRDLVRHRRGRQEDRRRLAEERSAACLELVDGRILALLLVADRGGGDRGAHPGGGPRRGVGAEVDHAAILRRRDRAAAAGELVLSSTQALHGRRYPGPMDLALLEGVLAERGEPAYRSRQVWEWAARGVAGYEEMTNVPASLREAARGRGAVLEPHARRRGPFERRHDQGALPHRRRASGRGRADALPRRTALDLRLVAVGLPAHLHVLRHRRDEVRAEPDAGRDPRPGAPLPPDRARRPSRVHGNGRADAEPRQRARRGAAGCRTSGSPTAGRRSRPSAGCRA